MQQQAALPATKCQLAGLVLACCANWVSAQEAAQLPLPAPAAHVNADGNAELLNDADAMVDAMVLEYAALSGDAQARYQFIQSCIAQAWRPGAAPAQVITALRQAAQQSNVVEQYLIFKGIADLHTMVITGPNAPQGIKLDAYLAQAEADWRTYQTVTEQMNGPMGIRLHPRRQWASLLAEAGKHAEAAAAFLALAEDIAALPLQVQREMGYLSADYQLQYAAVAFLKVNDADAAIKALTKIQSLEHKIKPANFHACIAAGQTGSDWPVVFALRWLEEQPWDVHTPGMLERLAFYVCFENRQELSEVIALYERLIKEHPDLLQAADKYSAEHSKKNRIMFPERAKRILLPDGTVPKYISTYPVTSTLTLIMYNIYDRDGQTLKAVELARRFMEEFPHNPSAAAAADYVFRFEQGDL